MNQQMIWLGGLLLTGMVVGCAKQPGPDAETAARGPSAEGKQYLLTAEPPAPLGLIAAREQTDDGEEVMVIGRIGGSVDPWVEGRAAFSLVDRSLAACTDIPGDTCPTPWDYCCVTDKLPKATALVKVVNDEGDIVSSDARELLGLKELQTVVVKGKAQRDDSGNMTILASKIFAHEGDLGQYPPVGAPSAHDHHHDHDHEHGGDDHDHEEHEHGDAAEDSADTPVTNEDES